MEFISVFDALKINGLLMVLHFVPLWSFSYRAVAEGPWSLRDDMKDEMREGHAVQEIGMQITAIYSTTEEWTNLSSPVEHHYKTDEKGPSISDP